VDLRLITAVPTAEERAAVDACLGAPVSAWDGGARGNERDAHVAFGGRSAREQRHLLLPALRSLQSRVGWISEGGLGYVSERLSVPPADAWAVATFYALLATSPRPRRVLHVCDDIACRTRGAKPLMRDLEASHGGPLTHAPEGDQVTIGENAAAWMHSPCLGLCEMAPAALLTESGPVPVERQFGQVTVAIARSILDGQVPARDAAEDPLVPQRGDPSLRLLRRVGTTDPTSLAEYRSSGGYAALPRALAMGAKAVIGELMESGLVGRGGAAFPTGRKWEAVRTQAARPHYLVCNADESEPGTFKDRVLLTHDPFAIVEAMTIAGITTGCEKGFLYVRAEYPLACERMQHAIDSARSAGFLGHDILGLGATFDIEIRRGGGAYICGEETAIFNSIEGYRGEPRNKPPFPVQAGLFGKPTLVNNVETLASIPAIVMEGGAGFARGGSGQSTGTRLFCLSGAVRRPGVYEVPLGTTLRALLDLAGGLPDGRVLQAILLGGAAGTFVRPEEIDLVLSHEAARAAGTTLGSGVVMAFDESADLRDVVRRIAAFFRDESCGQCVPCRVGTVRQEEALHRIATGRTIGAVRDEIALLDDVGAAMKDGSICGLGQTAYSAVESAVRRLHLYDDPSTGTRA
jgi:NADH-quinone oxidoreductase subunit F